MNDQVNPYVGPRAFEPGEVLYGRDREIRQLKALLVAERIVLVHSPSGAGKTSLIQAGLIPALTQDEFEVLPPIRVNLEPPAGLPEVNRYLLSTLLALEEKLPAERRIPPMQLATLSLDAYLTQRYRPDGAPDSVVLIFDQFEEILTTAPTDRAGKQAFFEQLGAALRNRSRWVLFAIREDYLGALTPYLRPIPNRLDCTYRLDLLSVAAARLAIQLPARRLGVEFNDETVAELIRDLSTIQVQSPDGTVEAQEGLYVEPVQLQVVCYRLWETRPAQNRYLSREDLTRVGSVDQALAEYYAASIVRAAQNTGVSERDIREWFDRHLITPGGIRGQVLMGSQHSEGLDNRAVRLLENAHLVRVERRGGFFWCELSHDRLIDPIRNDNRLWFAAHLSLLQRQARLWEDERHPDSLLLSGKELSDGETWATEHPLELDPHEHAYLAACRRARAAVEAQARSNRRIRTLLVIATLTALLALLLGFFAYRSNLTSQAIALAIESKQAYALGDKKTAAMLAVQSVSAPFPYTDQAEEALTNIIPIYEPGAHLVVAQSLHPLAFSPDGSRWAAANPDHSVSILDTPTGATLLKLVGHANIIRCAAFSPDGTQLVTASDGGDVRVWDSSNGSQRVVFFQKDFISINSVAFSPDSSLIVAVSEYGNVLIGEIAGAKWRLKLQTTWFSKLGKAFFSPDGRKVLVVSDHRVNIWDATSGTLLRDFYVDTTSMLSATFSPDGARFAALGEEGVVYLWNAVSGTQITRLQTPEAKIERLVFNSDGTRLTTICDDHQVRVWDIATSKVLFMLQGDSNFATMKSVAFSPDGLHLVTGSNDSILQVWNISTGEKILTLQIGDSNPITALAFSPDGSRLAVGLQDSTVQILNSIDGKKNLTLKGETLTGLDFSPDGSRLAMGGKNTIQIGDTSNGTAVGRIDLGRFANITHFAFRPDGVRMAIGFTPLIWGGLIGEEAVTDAAPNTIRIWDTTNGEEVDVLFGHTGSVRTAVFSPDGTRILTASDDGTARIWDATSGQTLFSVPDAASLNGHSVDLSDAALSPDGLRIATTAADRTVRIWEIASGQPLQVLSGLPSGENSVAFSPDGTQVVTGSTDHNLRVWDITSGKLRQILSGSARIKQVAFTSDGKKIVSASDDGAAYTWNASSGQTLRHVSSQSRLTGHTDTVLSVAGSPDGTRLLTGSRDWTARIWDPSSGKEIAVLSGHTGSVNVVAFRSDGAQIATGSQDGTARLWDPTDGKELAVLRGHHSGLTSIIFSPDGTLIATASKDHSVRIWNTATGTEICTLYGLADEVRYLDFSPDGKRIITGSRGGRIRIWEMSTGTETQQWKNIYDNQLGNNLYALKFSAGGHKFVLIAESNLNFYSIYHTLVQVWDIDSRKMIASFTRPYIDSSRIMIGTHLDWVFIRDTKSVQAWSIVNWQSVFMTHMNGIPIAMTQSTSKVDAAYFVLMSEQSEELFVGCFDPNLAQRFATYKQAIQSQWFGNVSFPFQETLQAQCGSCIPGFEERLQYRLYTFPIWIFENRRVVLSISFLLTYGVFAVVVYQAVSRQSGLERKSSSIVARLLSTTLVETIPAGLALCVLIITFGSVIPDMMITTSIATVSEFFSAIVFEGTIYLVSILFLFFLPGFMCAYRTRFLTGKRILFRRFIQSGWAGIQSGAIISLLANGCLIYIRMHQADDSSLIMDIVWLLTIFILDGCILTGLLSSIGAMVYISVVEPILKRRKRA